MTDGETTKISFLELLRLNEIKVKQLNYKLGMLDEYLSILRRVNQLGVVASVEDIDELQEQLRCILNKTDDDLRDIAVDKKFLEDLIERSKNSIL